MRRSADVGASADPCGCYPTHTTEAPYHTTIIPLYPLDCKCKMGYLSEICVCVQGYVCLCCAGSFPHSTFVFRENKENGGDKT